MQNLDYNNILRTLILIGYPIAGVFASLINLADSQIITIAYRAFIVLICIICIYKNKAFSILGNVHPLIISFFLMYFIRLMIDRGRLDFENIDRTILFFTFVVVIPVIGSAAGRFTYVDDEKIAKLCAIGGFILSTSITILKFMGLNRNRYEGYIEDDRLSFGALNPISVGYVGYVSFIAAIILSLNYSKGLKQKIWLILSFSGLIVLLFSNSRSPVLALFVAAAFLLIKNMDRFLSLSILSITVSLISLQFFSDEISHIVDRFTKGGGLIRDESREFLRSIALDAFIKHPIFGAYHLDPTMGTGFYPHNIFYDTAMSLGIIGIANLMLLLIYSMRNYIKLIRVEFPFMSLILIGMFVQVNASGSIWNYDSFFMALSLCLAAATRTNFNVTRYASHDSKKSSSILNIR